MTDNSALLVMDVQRAIVDRYDSSDGYLSGVRDAIGAARADGIPVIYVVVGVRPETTAVSRRNKTFANAAAGGLVAGGPGTDVHPAVAPEAGEPVVVKRRVSAFAGSDLDLLLRSGDIDNLVLTGIATSGVVLSTVRAAADLDYGLTVLADGCLDRDPEVHRVLTEKIFPRQADVQTIAQWAAGS